MVGFQESCEHVKHRVGLLPLVIVMRCANKQISRYPESYPRPSMVEISMTCSCPKRIGEIWTRSHLARTVWKPVETTLETSNSYRQIREFRHIISALSQLSVWLRRLTQFLNSWYWSRRTTTIGRSWFMIFGFSRINFSFLHIIWFLVPLVLFVFMLYHFLSVYLRPWIHQLLVWFDFFFAQERYRVARAHLHSDH